MRLKTAAAALASLLLASAAAARADDLVVGVVTDQDGVPVAGARVVARGSGELAVGSGASAADGSFAIPVTAAPARVEVGCGYCLGRTVALAPGEPAVVVVRRFRVLRDRGLPQPEDLAALPPQTLTAAAALIPFALDVRGGVSDRGLALGRDASAADGVPLYRRIDGVSLANLVPAVALRRIDPVACGFDAGLAGADGPALRAATSAAGGASLELGQPAHGSLLAALGNDRYAVVSAAARLPLAGGTLTSTALAASWDQERLAGATLAYATASRRYDTAASLALARSVVGDVPDAELLFDAHLRARSAAAPTLGVRGRTSSGGGSAPGTQADDAVYAAALAPLPGGTFAFGLAAGRAAYPSVAYDASRAGVALHAALATYPVAPAPGDPVAFARARLAELSLERGDLRRLDVLATAYDERIGGDVRSELTGVGVRLDWQAAPRLALRSWLLGTNRTVAAPGAGPYDPFAAPTYGYGAPAALAGRADRRLAWLTYENALRVDVLYRGGAFDAAVSAPLGGARLSLGTTTAIDGRRVLSLGLTR